MNLYELTTGLRAVHDQIEDAGGELTPDLEATLDNLNMELAVKAENIGKWVLNVRADEKAIQTEIDRLTAKKRGRVALLKRLKDYLRENMIAVDRKKIESPTVTVRVQGNSASVEIEDEDAIPACFKIAVPATFTIDKKELLKDLKVASVWDKELKEELEEDVQEVEDVESLIPGAKLITGKSHLRIS